MKKFAIAGGVLLLVLLLAPLAIGQLAAKRIESGMDRAVLEVPFLAIAERKYHTGWFSSDLDVTFELFPGVGDGESRRFTVHNDISHGPILGSGIGMARIKSHFVLKEEARRELEKMFGSDEPFDFTTIIGFSGGARTVVSSDAHQYKNDTESFSWDALKLVIESTGNGDSFTIDGKWPRIEGHNQDGTDVAFRGLSIMGAGKRIVGELFDTDVEFAIGEMSVKGPTDDVHIEGVRYVANTEPQGEFVNMSVKMGCGAFKAEKLDLKEAHYDFTMRRLHAATFDKLVTAMKTAYVDSGKDAALAGQQGIPEAYRKDVLELLKHDPELAIDRIGFATEEGDGAFKGVIKFKGVTEEDLAAGAMGLVVRLVADVDMDFSEAMIAKLTGSPEPTEGVIKQGLVERKEGRLVSKILVQDGKLLINGKEQALPGLGGPPVGVESAPRP